MSHNHQTIEAFEVMPQGRNCIRFEWERWSRVLQTQRQNHCKRFKKPFIDTFARLYRSDEYGYFRQTGIAVDSMVALPWSAFLLRTIRKRRRSVLDSALPSALCLKFKERQTLALLFFRFSQSLVLVSLRQTRRTCAPPSTE